MNTNISITLDTRRQKKDKTFPVIFRIGHNRRTIAINSGYSINEKEWDASERKVKGTYKGIDSPARLNNYLQKKKSGMMDIITALADKDELEHLSVSALKEKLVGVNFKTTVFEFTEEIIEDLIASKRIGTARSYSDVLNVLKAFRNQKDMTFHEMNERFLQSFERLAFGQG